MKKRILIFLILISCLSCIFAANKTPQMKEIKIQGGYDDVAAINIRPIPAQTESYKIGMPFALNDVSVRSKVDYKGRLIANWNILANKKFTLDIFAEILHNYGDNTLPNSYVDGLGYFLTFIYNISYYSKGQSYYIPDIALKIDVPNSPDSRMVSITGIDLLAGLDIENESLVGSAEGDIYFCFDETSTKLIESTAYDNLPDGNYSAQVIVVLKPEEV